MSAAPAPADLPRRIPIPAHLGDMSAEWLTERLRRSGTIGVDNAVVSYRTEALGEGEGFLGELARLHLEYAAAEAAAPPSVIVKTPSRLASNRGLAVMLGAYENEIRFYHELAGTVGVRVPAAYVTAMTREPKSAALANRVVGRLPGSLTLRMLGALTSAAASTPRRFGLVIEDMRDSVPGDQVAGADFESAATALRALATIHARFWESADLYRPWLRSADYNRGFTQALFRRAWPLFWERYEHKLPASLGPVGEHLQKHGENLLTRLARSPRTLLHGDYRLDNVMYDRADRSKVTIIDWQGVAAGNGMCDVAYFLRTNLLPDVADAHEDDLLRLYHDALVERGVTGYSLEQCLSDFYVATAWLIHRGATLVGLLDLSHERGQAIVDRAVERSARKSAELTPERLTAAGI
jgi:aminoglycoside phosphotransferase (APT) family kinase protein